MRTSNYLKTLALCGCITMSLTGQLAAADSATTVISKNDKDDDKTLDLAEVKAAASNRFARLNKDVDSTLDLREVKGVIGAKAFAAADTDHDGTLSQDEYLALVQKLFKQADTDHDGTLDGKELGSKTGQTLKRLIS